MSQEEHEMPMSPFGDFRHVIPSATRRCPSGRCAVCCSQLAQLREKFAAMVRQSWSPAEIDILTKAEHSALL